MFFFLLMVAGNDSTRAVFTSGMKNLIEDPEQMELVRSGAVPLEQVVEEFVRYNPAFAYMRRTATSDTELAGKQVRAGDKLALWYVSGNRDEERLLRPAPLRRAAATPTRTRDSAAADATSASAPGLARLELKLWIEETLRRFAADRRSTATASGSARPSSTSTGRCRSRSSRPELRADHCGEREPARSTNRTPSGSSSEKPPAAPGATSMRKSGSRQRRYCSRST